MKTQMFLTLTSPIAYAACQQADFAIPYAPTLSSMTLTQDKVPRSGTYMIPEDPNPRCCIGLDITHSLSTTGKFEPLSTSTLTGEGSYHIEARGFARSDQQRNGSPLLHPSYRCDIHRLNRKMITEFTAGDVMELNIDSNADQLSAGTTRTIITDLSNATLNTRPEALDQLSGQISLVLPAELDGIYEMHVTTAVMFSTGDFP